MGNRREFLYVSLISCLFLWLSRTNLWEFHKINIQTIQYKIFRRFTGNIWKLMIDWRLNWINWVLVWVWAVYNRTIFSLILVVHNILQTHSLLELKKAKMLIFDRSDFGLVSNIKIYETFSTWKHSISAHVGKVCEKINVYYNNEYVPGRWFLIRIRLWRLPSIVWRRPVVF